MLPNRRANPSANTRKRRPLELKARYEVCVHVCVRARLDAVD